MPSKSYLSASELELTFGLGKSDRVDAVEITWPGGMKQSVEAVEIDRRTVIQESR